MKASVAPNQAPPAPQPEARPPRIDNAPVRAPARAFRWRRMLESGDHGSVADLAHAEKIGRPCVGAMPRLTPDVAEAILEGRRGEGVTPAASRGRAARRALHCERNAESRRQAPPSEPMNRSS